MTTPRFGDPPGKGWFAVEGIQTGDRKLADQLRGLSLIVENCRGKTVLDLGAAEGLIAQHLCDNGALSAHCMEIVPSRVKTGRELCHRKPVTFWTADAQEFPDLHAGTPDMPRRYDIVLCLAILHKLPRPDVLLAYLSVICREWLAIRLPDPVLDDPRSRSMKLDITAALANRFERVQALRTYRDEWTAIFRRR